MRKCNACELDEEKTAFSPKGKKCKSCVSKYNRTHYVNNKSLYMDKNKRNNKRARDRNRLFVKKYLKLCGCTDCGLKDWRVLEFDHIRDKSSNISEMIKRQVALSKLKQEIRKCEVVCANCHKLRTYSRMKVCHRKI